MAHSHTPPHYVLAALCVGLFAGAMALNSVPYPEDVGAPDRGILWNAFQYAVPLLMGGMCLTGQRWIFMTVVIYGTIGLALDLATFLQSLTNEQDPVEFLLVIGTTALLNFLLILLGGKAIMNLGPSK